METTVQVFNVGGVGVISDLPPHTLPPEAWSDAFGVRFTKKGVQTFGGRKQVFGTPTVAPGFIFYVPSGADTFWLYGDLDKVYVYDNGVHTNITRGSGDYTATELWQWNTCILGGIPILNNSMDVPQFWATLNAGTDLADLTNWPSNLRAKAVRAFGRWLVALNITEDGDNFPHVVRWSHAAEPGEVPSSWDPSDPTVDAGQLSLTDVEGGIIMDGLMLGNSFIIYKQTSTHMMRTGGGANFFALDLLLASSGILATNCVTAIKKGTQHFVVTEDDVIVHGGTKDAISVADDKTRERIFTDIDPENRDKCFVVNNERRSEAWICYCSAGAEHPNRAAVYNYVKDTWTFIPFNGTSAAQGLVTGGSLTTWNGDTTDRWDDSATDEPWSSNQGRGIVVADFENSVLRQVDIDATWDPAPGGIFVERRAMAMVGRDRQGQPKVDYRVNKLIHRVWPKITGAGQINVYVGGQDDFDSEVVWSNPVLFDPSSQKYVDLDVPVNTKLPGFKFESVDPNVPWRLEGYDVDMSLVGNL